jgi:hypothetical protein
MGTFRDIENSGFQLNYPVETAAELVWMSLHGLVAALINNPEFTLDQRDLLIDGLIARHGRARRGEGDRRWRMNQSIPLQRSRGGRGPLLNNELECGGPLSAPASLP